jgi:hypothetical protein
MIIENFSQVGITLNHLFIALIVNYGVDCKFAINNKKVGITIKYIK